MTIGEFRSNAAYMKRAAWLAFMVVEGKDANEVLKRKKKVNKKKK
jgi:hypothetical protein